MPTFAKVQRWGNSLALRLPKAVALQLGLHPGARVELRLQDDRLIIVPASTPSLAELLERMPDEPSSEVDWGAPEGREVW